MAPPTARFCGLETDASAQLDLAARSRDLGDAAEARSVNEPVRCSIVGVIERVEEFSARFKRGSLSHVELTHYAKIHGLQSGSVDRIAAGVPVGVGGRRDKRGGIHPRR